jgi:hypothetical protein
VLDVRYSSSEFLSARMMDFITQLREFNVIGVDYWDITLLQGRLRNIRKLRARSLMNGAVYANRNNSDRENLFSGKDKMELLDFSGNSRGRLYVERSCRSLETIIIDGSSVLQEISLMGCSKLKNLLLSGSFPELYSIYITDATVKTLDLSAVRMVPKLDELFLLECGEICAILWPPMTAEEDTERRYLGKLQIDTTKKEVTNVAAASNEDNNAGRSPREFS